MKKTFLVFLCFLIVLISILPISSAAAITEQNKVTVLISLDEPCLLDCCGTAQDNDTPLSDYLLSDQGKSRAFLIMQQQAALKSTLLSSGVSADYSESRSYTSLVNGFTAKVSVSEIPKIQTHSAVRSVKVMSSAKEKVSPNNSDGSSSTAPQKTYRHYGMASKSSIQIESAYDEGYTGKGMLIAVIDNEFDVRHDAFSVAPDEKRYTKDDICKLSETIGFGIASYPISDIFYNGKIVFAYDYGEKDNNCKRDTDPHGTHVAGIAAGNNQGKGIYSFKGTAYDSQLALFKISDQTGALQDEAILAALDDAVKLSPDVINCSYGAIEFLTHDYEGRQLYEKLTRSGCAVIAASGNDSYNGYLMGMTELPVSYMNYSTVCSPSSMESVCSVAASVPDQVYAAPYYFVFNQEKRVRTEMVYSSLRFEEVYGEPAPLSKKPLTEEDDGQNDVELDEVSYLYLEEEETVSDLSRRKIEGKIVVLNENSLSIDTIIKDTVRKNCYAVIIIQKETDSRIRQQSETKDFFVYTVDHSCLDYFTKHPKGKVSIRTSSELDVETPAAAQTIAEYSSFGTRADMALKPDLTAPGDNILSSIPNHGYSMMSGTSMATPCVSGAYAIMKQYLKESGIASTMSPCRTEEHIYRLLMSTADLLKYQNTSSPLYYSPRLQGAGLIDLDSAIHTESFLTVDGERPSVSLKDHPDGAFTFQFTVCNTSDHTMTFSPSCILQTDGYQKAKKPQYGMEYVHTFIPQDIRAEAEIHFYTNDALADTFTVPAHSEQTVTAEILLHSDFVSSHSRIFTNGFYVDGFVILNTEDNKDLSLPFSGFCGDWTNGSIFPQKIYNEDAPFPSANSTLAIVSSFDSGSAFSESAGINIFGFQDLPSVIAFGKNSLRSFLNIPDTISVSPSVLLPDIYILRDAMDYTISIFDSEGILLFCQNFGDISSYFHPTDAPNTNFTDRSKSRILDEYYAFADTMKEGRYTYLLSASRVGTDGNPEKRDLMSFTVYVDNTPPVLQNCRLRKTADGRLILQTEATDNIFLQGIRLSAVQLDDQKNVSETIDLRDDMLQYFGSTDAFVDYQYDSETGKYRFNYDLTDYKELIRSLKKAQKETYSDDDLTIIFENDRDFSLVKDDLILLEAVDSAYHCSEQKLIDVDAYGEAVIYLKDAYGAPLTNVEVLAAGETYRSDARGILMLYDLPMGNIKMKLLSDYETTDAKKTVLLPITKDCYQYESVLVLQKVTAPLPDPSVSSEESRAHSSHEKAVIVNYQTGESDQISVMIAADCTAALFLLLRLKRKNTEIDQNCI